MKKLLIIIAVIIIAIFAYSEYKEYQRFHPKSAHITKSRKIDVNYHNQETVYNYYDAIEQANSYMTVQWSANEIDVRTPEKNDKTHQLATKIYAEKLSRITYYETILEQSEQLKKEGLSNEDIIFLETKGISLKEYNVFSKVENFRKNILELMPNKKLYAGEKTAFIFELQKLLVKNGFNIPVDGVYQKQTSDALKTFEEKHNFLPDGKIDLLTLKALLN